MDAVLVALAVVDGCIYQFAIHITEFPMTLYGNIEITIENELDLELTNRYLIQVSADQL